MKPDRRLTSSLILSAMLAASIIGCRSQHADPSTVARVRIIDAAPGPDRLDFAVDGHTVARRVEYRSNSGYIDLDPGHYSLSVKSEHAPDDAGVSGELGRGESYTVLALQDRNLDLDLKVIREKSDVDPAKDQAALRFIDASNTPALSLALDNVIAVDGLKRSTESRPLTLAPGDYEIKLWTGDDSAQLLGPSTIHLDGGRAYTVVAMGRRADGSLSLQTYQDN